MSWISGSDILNWIGVDKIDSNAAQSLADVSTSMLHQVLERDITLATTTEVYDSNGTDYILLNRWPVVSIGGVTYNGAPVVPAAYQVPGWKLDGFNTRKLCFVGMGKLARNAMNITVTDLAAGYDVTLAQGQSGALPGNIYHALRLTALAVFNSQASDPNLATESTAGVFSGSFYPAGVGAVPPGALTLLQSEMRVAP
jgi:hypothetical protein